MGISAILAFLILFAIILSSCSQKQVIVDKENAQIANPASTYCIEQGGKLEIKDSAEGQYGICTLPDGTECEEWKYFRKECP